MRLPPDPRRRIAPATARNREPIRDVLREILPPSGTVIEVASGSGEHAVYFGHAFPELTWQPSDVDDANLSSIQAWIEATGSTNVLPPLRLDLDTPPEPTSTPRYDAGFCANLVHIAPWQVCIHLMQWMGAHLEAGAPLVTYGPYKVNNQHTSESNVAFERWLWSLSPEYGVRDKDAVVAEAEKCGFTLVDMVPMPANNFCLVFRRG
jgi:hypothetical protein